MQTYSENIQNSKEEKNANMRYWLTNGLEMGVKAPLEPLPMPSTGTASHYCHNMQLQNVYFSWKTGADFF